MGGGGGGLIDLAKMMVSILHKDLERKVETLKQMTLEVLQWKIQNKIELPAHE